mmetsp:Transcript_8126/g.22029  ORF Transcript_8126/g.22029 Transcript_8126/m.22029 type:complete len:201 (+) Transcript_8126:306-908(+)
MQRPVGILCQQMGECAVHHRSDAVAVDVVHCECPDVQVTDPLPFGRINISQPDIHDLLWRQLGNVLQEFKSWKCREVNRGAWLVLMMIHKQSDRHAMHVPALARGGRVQVGVCINPNDPGVGSDREDSCQRTRPDGMIATQNERELVLLYHARDSVEEEFVSLADEFAILGIRWIWWQCCPRQVRIERKIWQVLHSPAKR